MINSRSQPIHAPRSYGRLRPSLVLYLALGALAAVFLGDFSAGTVLLGFGVAWVIGTAVERVHQGRLRPHHVVRLTRMIWDFAIDLTVSNIQLAWDVLTPTDLHEVTMVRVPVDDLSPGEIAFLCHRITLTPGTLSCAVDPDQTEILVHVMYPPKDEDMSKSLRRPIDILKGRS